MVYGSVCSGIEAASVAWEELGWKPAWFSEIEDFPSKVLNYRFPEVPNLGDMTKLIGINETFERSAIDLLVGGTPCQSFSTAGLRKGLASSNGNLALEYCRILIAKRPRWFCWENVPGVLSSFSNEAGSIVGNNEEQRIWETSDFATLLEAFRQCGYSCAFRVLDAQYFGVPQRRRRVFVVGHLGADWRIPATVLFERESLRGDLTPRQIKGRETAPPIVGRPYQDRGSDTGLIAYGIPGNWIGRKPENGGNQTAPMDNTSPCLNATDLHAVAGCWWDGGQTAQTLDAVLAKGQTMPEKNRFPSVLQESQSSPIIRRLTPLECERLQGFPDNWTNIPGAKDLHRYKAIGNSKAIPVVKWIGKRIKLVEENIHLFK